MLRQHVLTATEALLLLYGAVYVSNCMQERLLNAGLHYTTGSRTEVAVQRLTRAWSFLTMSAGIRGVETAYSLRFISSESSVLLRAIKLRSECF